MTVIAISGGFDPPHKGHAKLIEEAAKIGGNICHGCGRSTTRIHVYLNSDEWLIRKKGYCLMPFADRAAVMGMMQNVAMVIPVIDKDDTVCETIRTFKPDYFVNGGDRMADNVPELKTCLDLKIPMLFNIGGGKIQSSSELVKKVMENV